MRVFCGVDCAARCGMAISQVDARVAASPARVLDRSAESCGFGSVVGSSKRSVLVQDHSEPAGQSVSVDYGRGRTASPNWNSAMPTFVSDLPQASRRGLLAGGAALGLSSLIPSIASARATTASASITGDDTMSYVTTSDGVQIYYKDWGPKDAQPIVFHHGWPLSSDDWDSQMMYFVLKGFRVVAHDRRGHGRSSQVSEGHDMDHYAADAAAVANHLDLRNAVHIGHSTGGGEVVRYVVKHGAGRVAKAVLVSSVPPLMLKTAANPEGTPIEVFDGFRASLAANRAEFYKAVASGPFYGFNRPGATQMPAVVDNWWRQGMTGGAKAHYDGIKAFSETDFTEELKVMNVPTFVIQGDDDQIVPYKDASVKTAALLPNGTLKIYPGFPHGMLTTHGDVINPDLLAFIQS